MSTCVVKLHCSYLSGVALSHFFSKPVLTERAAVETDKEEQKQHWFSLDSPETLQMKDCYHWTHYLQSPGGHSQTCHKLQSKSADGFIQGGFKRSSLGSGVMPWSFVLSLYNTLLLYPDRKQRQGRAGIDPGSPQYVVGTLPGEPPQRVFWVRAQDVGAEGWCYSDWASSHEREAQSFSARLSSPDTKEERV